MIVLQSIIAAVIPAVIYTSLIYYIDRYEKEPLWLLAATFGWGMVPAILLALFFNAVFGFPFYFLFGEAGNAAVASFVAPLVEESVKGIVMLIILFMWREQIDSLLDGIIYGAMVGMGFAMIENIFYFVQVFEEGGREAWQLNIFLRAVLFGLNHALFTGMTGLGVAVARLTPQRGLRVLAPMLGWGAAVVLHGVHNLSASAVDVVGLVACIPLLANEGGGLFITAVIIIWSLWQEKQWIQRHLREEVALGTLTTRQYEIARSAFTRLGHRWQLLFTAGPQAFFTALNFYFLCSRLAYSKQHYQTLQDEESLHRVEQLRAEVSQQSREVL